MDGVPWEMKYKALQQQIFTSGNYSLIPLRREDILLIKEWRNAQLDILRQDRLLTDEDQINYYEFSIVPLFYTDRPEQVLFSMLIDDACMGYGGIVHISWPNLSGEISFLVSPDRSKAKDIYHEDFKAFLYLIKFVAFNELGLNRIYTEAYDIRKHHVEILEEAGFKFEGRLKEHVRIGNKFVDALMHGFIKTDYEHESER